ncbi:putative sorting nexin C terminal [Lyophyllum shimeji]|uniref:Sorting nexin C terminal n=1 Tax=Lyophyllum shimeji TaxID=47721 RepID=A0A9P3PI21_LYOSH|nr:putative sorting nexin C terminal [Lyophyllum shimeji]
MTPQLSSRTVVLVGLLAVALPVFLRIISSPLLLLLISPLVLLLLGLLFLSSNLFLGYLADKSANNRNDLQRAARPFAFSTPAAWQAVLTRSQWSQNTPQSFPPLCPDAPLVSSALNDILIMIVRDFVLTWYKDLSSSPSFPMAVSTVLHESLERLLDRASAVDLPVLLVKRILPKITAHVEQFRQSEVALRGAGLERKLTQSEELDLLLASRYAGKGGKLHPAIENLSTTFTKQTEEIHLRQLVEKALPFILPETESRSQAFKLVVREIVVCTVLQPVLDMVSDPDFWNRAIDQVAGAAIHQQKLITKVRNVLEAQSPRSQPRQSPTAPLQTELITIRTDVRQFESFLRSISRCSSLLDARRLKNDVGGEIRRTRLLLANHDKEEWINGEKTEDVVAFLDRLYTAKRKVEERIVVLGGDEDHEARPSYQESTQKSGLTLRDVLRNPSSLSYFMEFMDRRHRSLLVQFWLTVESFKNPLESVESDSSDGEDQRIQDLSSSATVKEDISMIYDLYFSRSAVHPALASISKKHVDVIRAFAENQTAPTPSAQRKVRRSVMLAQRQVERTMEQDFDDFERSELWFRAIGDTDFGGVPSLADDFSSKERQPSPGPSSARSTAHSKYGHTAHLTPTPSEPITGPVMQRTVSAGSHRSHNSLHHPPVRPSPSNIEVLMSPVSDPESESSRPPLFDDPEDKQQREEEKRMEAIQAALTDIMALEQEQSGTPSRKKAGSSRRTAKLVPPRDRGKRRPMFDDDNDDDEADDDADVDADEAGADETHDEHASFQLAAPGDLQLSYEIARLGDNIANLEAQDLMLDTLIKKAELTGDTQELKLLVKSKSAMTRDLRELKFQKLQYEQQESANRLIPDRTKLSIVSSTVGEEAGKSVVRYLVEVQQLAADGKHASGWVVARRYNEFFNLHNKLRERYGLVRNLDFPGKRLVTALSGSFVDTRRVGLEKYLQSVVAIPIVCESDELRAFLSRDSPFVAHRTADTPKGTSFSGTDLVRNVYRSVTESIDDMFFGPSMLDVMIQRLTRQAAEFAGIVGSGVNDEDLVAQALKASGKTSPDAAFMQLPGDLKPLEGETSTSTFSAPICDLVLAVFELNKKDNWLRRQAIVIILQQVLGGTIERKIRDNIRLFLEEARVLSLIKMFRDSLWPGGKLKPPGIPRSYEEKLHTRDEANRKLSSLVPDLAANMIGRSNARRGARRMFAVLQNRRLNQHIAYTVVDEVFAALFPEAAINSTG